VWSLCWHSAATPALFCYRNPFQLSQVNHLSASGGHMSLANAIMVLLGLPLIPALIGALCLLAKGHLSDGACHQGKSMLGYAPLV